jgi:peptidoglycan hydrolase-like protein with peptidoglycan-binding domain
MAYTCAIPGISLTNYTFGPLSKGWGSPCAGQYARVQLTVAAVSVHVGLAELVGLIMRANETQGYRYRQPDTGAYNCRKIAGTTTWSNHAWGLAVDANWQTNPFTADLRTDRPSWEIQRWNRFGFAWGGHYTGRKDAMHTEFMGTPDQAQAALVLARTELGGGVTPAPPAPPSDDGWHDVPLGGVSDLNGKGEQVRRDQADLTDTGFILPVDGYWGATSVARAKEFQRAAGITQDGEFGPDSRTMIHKVPSWTEGAAGGGHLPAVWQTRLKEHGWHITVDGVWGTRSTSILSQFQAEKHIPVTGVRDAPSWTALYCQPN